MNSIATTLEKLQKQLTEALQQASSSIQKDADRLEATAQSASGGVIQPITRCELPESVTRRSLDGFAQEPGRYSSRPSWQQNVQAARAVLNSSRGDIERQHALNLPVIENNIEVVAQVKRIMTNLGIPESRTTFGYATPRARKMTRSTVTAGYIGDLAAVCKTDDGYAACCRHLESFEERINAYERQQQLEEAKVKAEQQKKDSQRAQLIVLGQLSAKYACDADTHSLLEGMCNRDKYFALAYWLERNRIDWHEGPACAERGLGYFFPLESDEERRIYEEIKSFCEDWDGDGRVFRDSFSNYTVLFAKADPEVLTDYELLKKSGLLADD